LSRASYPRVAGGPDDAVALRVDARGGCVMPRELAVRACLKLSLEPVTQDLDHLAAEQVSLRRWLRAPRLREETRAQTRHGHVVNVRYQNPLHGGLENDSTESGL
jgi:hypothetical protein